MRGGAFQTIFESYDTSTIDFVGSEFAVNGSPVSPGPLAPSETTQTLTGKLEAGDFIGNSFYIHDDSSMILVPEPGAAMLAWASLFAIGGLSLLRARS